MSTCSLLCWWKDANFEPMLESFLLMKSCEFSNRACARSVKRMKRSHLERSFWVWFANYPVLTLPKENRIILIAENEKIYIIIVFGGKRAKIKKGIDILVRQENLLIISVKNWGSLETLKSHISYRYVLHVYIRLLVRSFGPIHFSSIPSLSKSWLQEYTNTLFTQQ